jgi:hypothetical protein
MSEPENKETNQPDLTKEIEALKTQNAELMAKLQAKEQNKTDEDLTDKAKRLRESEDRKASDAQALEAALKFQLGSGEFLKQNAALLPKEINDIFKAAEAERYESAIEKDNAVKSGMIQSFFKVQSNLDLLTPGLKSTLEDYLKLTKTGREERAQDVYRSVFEPAFEMLKRVKKAEALSKGYAPNSNSEDAYKQKMIALSKKHFMGDKA